MNNEELRTRALTAIVVMLEMSATATLRVSDGRTATIDFADAGAIRTLAEAYATIEKAGHEVNMYDVIKGMYGTGIKGNSNV